MRNTILVLLKNVVLYDFFTVVHQSTIVKSYDYGYIIYNIIVKSQHPCLFKKKKMLHPLLYLSRNQGLMHKSSAADMFDYAGRRVKPPPLPKAYCNGR